MKGGLFYTVMTSILIGVFLSIWDYKHSIIPVSDVEAMKLIDSPFDSPPGPLFYMDKYEVTNGKFWRYNQNHSFKKEQIDFPVTNITWWEAVEYLKWAGKRLPHANEWNYARHARKREFSAWNSIEPLPIPVEKPGIRLVRVGKFWRDQIPFGVLDMDGNAWEWTADTLRLENGKLAAIVKSGFIYKDYQLDYSKPGQSDTVLVSARLPYVGLRGIKNK